MDVDEGKDVNDIYKTININRIICVFFGISLKVSESALIRLFVVLFSIWMVYWLLFNSNTVTPLWSIATTCTLLWSILPRWINIIWMGKLVASGTSRINIGINIEKIQLSYVFILHLPKLLFSSSFKLCFFFINLPEFFIMCCDKTNRYTFWLRTANRRLILSCNWIFSRSI